MAAPILFPDVEAWVIGYLRAALVARPEPVTDGVWVGNQVTTPQTRMVLVRDDGGPRLGDVRAVARLGVQVWAGSEEDVADLANLVSTLVASCADGRPVVRSTASRPYSVADDSGRPKMYLTGELVVRGDSI